MPVVIRAEHLAKEYRIRPGHRPGQTLRETVARAFRHLSPVRTRPRSPAHDLDGQATWPALKDVSFDVSRGEIVGLIGRNGSGKSTLLKILSRITPPTRGLARLAGRVGSLLEVGTGFHPDLTGRENTYLNGAIIGLRRADIERRFDEIVAFAEVERFIDTPVKHYSSGMYLRLAFAVAAHLDPDILLVDEVLAVGDAEFQQKCIGRMREFAAGDRTVLFVSHNTAAVKHLCTRALLLEDGIIQADGPPDLIVPRYLESERLDATWEWAGETRPGNGACAVRAFRLTNAQGDEVRTVTLSTPFCVELEFEVLRDRSRVAFTIVVVDATGNLAFQSFSNADAAGHGRELDRGVYRTRCEVPGDLLNSGRHHVGAMGFGDNWTGAFRIERPISFEAVDDGVLRRDYLGPYPGTIRPRLTWTTAPVPVEVAAIAEKGA